MTPNDEDKLFNELTGSKTPSMDDVLATEDDATPTHDDLEAPAEPSGEPAELSDTPSDDLDADAALADVDDLPEVDTTPPGASPSAPAQTIPAGVAKDLRAQRRALREQLDAERIEKARLQGRLEALEQQRQMAAVDQPKPKSPIEEAIDQDPNTIIDADLYAKQKAWELQQQKQQEEAQARATAEQAKGRSELLARFSAEKMGEGLDLASMLTLGQAYLTQGDLIDIQSAGDQHAQGAALYKALRNRILINGGPNAQVLRQRMAARKARSTQLPKPQATANTAAAPAKPGVGHVAETSQPVTNTKAILDFMFAG